MATIYGTSGEDILRGTAGPDAIYGYADDDYIRGGQGRDFIYGGTNSDTLDGGIGNDILYGQGGPDWLFGGNGNDRLFGGGGDDALNDGAGADSLYGAAGNDRLTIGRADNSADLYDGGTGTDSLRIYAFNDNAADQDYAVRINLLRGTLRIGDGPRDTVATVENVEIVDSGSDLAGDDAVNGSPDNNRIEVGAGQNVVYAGLGDDTISGSGLLNGGAGDDDIAGMGTLIGGDGNDTIAFAGTSTMAGGADQDEFWFKAYVSPINGAWVDGEGTILDYEAGEKLHVGSATTAFVGETDDVGPGEIGYHHEGNDTVIEFLTDIPGSIDATIRLVGYTGALSASDFDLG